MLRSLYFLIPLLSFALFFTSCVNDDNGDPPETGNCPPGTNFCMDYEGETKSGLAELSEPGDTNPRVRIIWEDVANVKEQVQMDIYGQAPGDYVVDTTRATGTAYIEYFNADKNTTLLGIGGTVNVSTFQPSQTAPNQPDPNQPGVGLTGSFEVMLDDDSQITNGHFFQVTKP